MRFGIVIVLLLFLFSCFSDGRKTQYKVIPPVWLKAIVEQSVKSPVKPEQEPDRDQKLSDIHRIKQKQSRNKPVEVVIVTRYKPADPARIKNIEWLRTSGIQADLSEPYNKELLERQSGDTLFKSMITLGSDRILKIGFDNDLFDNTDRFYTNGISFDYTAPGISDNPVKYVLLPYRGRAKNYYGLVLVQNLYTPSTTKIGGIQHGDRPFAAYLYFGSYKITSDDVRHYRQVSELDLGILGPQSMGAQVQDVFHKYIPYNNEPLGWENQIATDAVINYNFSLEKGIVNTEFVQLIVSGKVALGTLYTNAGGGFNLRLGWFNDYFSDLGVRKKRLLRSGGFRVTQYFFTVKGTARFVAYDATLEGGLINHNSIYTIPSSGLTNIVTQSSIGFTVTIGGIGLELEQVVLSPEFSINKWHAWGHIGLLLAL